MMREAIGQVGAPGIGCASKPGIQHQKTSLAGLGVLLNVARYHSVPWLDPGYAIGPDLLDEVARSERRGAAASRKIPAASPVACARWWRCCYRSASSRCSRSPPRHKAGRGSRV